MAAYHITIINEEYRSSEDIEAATPADARTEALRGALSIGADEVCEGKMSFGAEVSIEGDGGAPERLQVAIKVSPLQ